MRRIIRPESIEPRVTPEPFFDILTKWAKESLEGNKISEINEEVKEALDAWENCDNDCGSCLFCRYESWIHTSNIQRVYDLCDLLSALVHFIDEGKKLKKRKHRDLWSNWRRQPGSYACRQ